MCPSPVCVSSYDKYAGHLEYKFPLIPQIHGIPSIAHLLTMS